MNAEHLDPESLSPEPQHEPEPHVEFVSDQPRRVTVAMSPETWSRPNVPMSSQDQRGLIPLALRVVDEIFADEEDS